MYLFVNELNIVSFNCASAVNCLPQVFFDKVLVALSVQYSIFQMDHVPLALLEYLSRSSSLSELTNSDNGVSK